MGCPPSARSRAFPGFAILLGSPPRPPRRLLIGSERPPAAGPDSVGSQRMRVAASATVRDGYGRSLMRSPAAVPVGLAVMAWNRSQRSESPEWFQSRWRSAHPQRRPPSRTISWPVGSRPARRSERRGSTERQPKLEVAELQLMCQPMLAAPNCHVSLEPLRGLLTDRSDCALARRSPEFDPRRDALRVGPAGPGRWEPDGHPSRAQQRPEQPVVDALTNGPPDVYAFCTRQAVSADVGKPHQSKKPPRLRVFGGGRYWARTSDPQLVELVLSQLS